MMEELKARAERVAALLIERRDTIAVAESSTGGLIAAALLSTAGASRFFVGGGVIYTETARRTLLGITPDLMEGLRPATEPYAVLLAEAARGRLGTTWGLAETGAAGPTGNRYGDPAGHTCLALSGAKAASMTIATGSSDRFGNMVAFAAAALGLVEAELARDDAG